MVVIAIELHNLVGMKGSYKLFGDETLYLYNGTLSEWLAELPIYYKEAR